MANIIYDTSKLKVMEFLNELSEYAGMEEGFAESVWQHFFTHPEIYKEFVYYIDHHELSGKYEIRGYNILDCYVWQRNNYIFRHLDRGKIERDCNEETMVLQAFEFMMRLEEEPEVYIKKLQEDMGRDKMR